MEQTQNKEELLRQEEVLKALMELLEKQGKKNQAQDFSEVLNYVVGMQTQLQTITNELQGLKNEIADMQKNQSLSMNATVVDLDKVSSLQKNSTLLSEHMSAIKEQMVDTAKKALTTFKERGKAEVNKVLQKGISIAKTMLESRKEQLMNVLSDYKKVANQIDSIGMELKQIGISFSNIGRLMAGKEAQAMSNDKVGVALTRVINSPIKKHIQHLEEKIGRLDKMIDKLDKMYSGLDGKNLDAQTLETEPISESEKEGNLNPEEAKETEATMKQESEKQQAEEKITKEEAKEEKQEVEAKATKKTTKKSTKAKQENEKQEDTKVETEAKATKKTTKKSTKVKQENEKEETTKSKTKVSMKDKMAEMKEKSDNQQTSEKTEVSKNKKKEMSL